MAELADALDSGSSESNFMEVQVLLPASAKSLENTVFSRLFVFSFPLSHGGWVFVASGITSKNLRLYYSMFLKPSYRSLKELPFLHLPYENSLFSPNSSKKHFANSSTVCSSVVKNC